MIFNALMAFTMVLAFIFLTNSSDVPADIPLIFLCTGLILAGIAVAIREIKK